MRLVDLSPRWLAAGVGRYGMGVEFLCPCGIRCETRHEVWFANPIDSGPSVTLGAGIYRHWSRTGKAFTNLTLFPEVEIQKVYLDAYDTPFVQNVHWRGWIRG